MLLPKKYRTIKEVADALGVAQHVLRFWEQEIPQARALQIRGRRYYNEQIFSQLVFIKDLLHKQGLSIQDAKLKLKSIKEYPVPREIEQEKTIYSIQNLISRFSKLQGEIHKYI